MKKVWKPQLFLGPMFAGKTTKLIKTINYYRRLFALPVIYLLRSSLDKRSKKDNFLTTHGKQMVKVKVFQKFADFQVLYPQIQPVKVLFISEMQFYSLSELEAIFQFAKQAQIHIVGEGLDRDFRGELFPFQAHLKRFAPQITFLTARCQICFAKATRSFRFGHDQTLFLPGGKALYQPLCQVCYAKTRR